MLANFPKGLFQSEADKTFGICRLINPWLVAKDWQNYRPSLHVTPVVRTLLVCRNMRQNSWKNQLRVKYCGRLEGPWIFLYVCNFRMTAGSIIDRLNPFLM